jgi:Amt family ammonium transporter
MNSKLAAAASVLAVSIPGMAWAQDPYAAAGDSGDTALVLICSALALLMVLPGLGLFYGGLVRAKNFLSVLLQIGAITGVVSLLWIVVGYTLAFGAVGSGWLGAGNAWMLIDLGNVRAGTSISESTFALFQLAFAAFAPVLMVGAWAERARFGWVIGFCALWSLVVYAPVAHWIWGGGWLAGAFGTLDFAGGIVVHVTAGVSSLVAALLLGRRAGFAQAQIRPHAQALAVIGAMLLWIGWFSLNGGSALTATDDAALAILNTQAAASTAALVWLLIEKLTVGKPTSIGFATGAITGLVAITPAAGFVSPGAAIVIGAVTAPLVYRTIRLVKQRWHIDDSLDVFAVHGIGGMTGSILLAFFLSPTVGGTGYAEGMNMSSQIAAQLSAIVVVALWSAISTAILSLAVSLFLPMRVSEEEELQGLDFANHDESARDFD